MGAQMRIYRQRIRSVNSIKKITNAMELIAAARVAKARQRVDNSRPYSHALMRAVAAVATNANEDHPLTSSPEQIRRAGVVVMTSDRGLAGAYSISVIKEALSLIKKLQGEGKEVVPYLVGRKAVTYFNFRHMPFAAEWTGFTDAPTFEHAEAIADRILEDFLRDYDAGGHDELYVVFTRFKTMVTQEPLVVRMLPLEVVDADAVLKDDQTNVDLSVEAHAQGQLSPQYAFEPSATEALDALLPQYITHRIYVQLLNATASELAARQRAMKSATDNAGELIKKYERLANQARQAGITQEISEIVGGADALASAK